MSPPINQERRTKPVAHSAIDGQQEKRLRERKDREFKGRYLAAAMAEKGRYVNCPGPKWPGAPAASTSTKGHKGLSGVNLLCTTIRIKNVRASKMRWRIERDYQELKDESGLDHY